MTTRRGFLSVAATAVVVGVIAGIGGYYAGLMGEPSATITTTKPTTLTNTLTTTRTTTVGAGEVVTTTTTVTPQPVTKTVTSSVTTTDTVTTTVTAGPEIPGRTPEEQQKLVEAANKEGKFVLYAGVAIQTYEMIFESFKEKYPSIIPEYGFRGSTAEVYSKYESERIANKDVADILQVSARGFESFLDWLVRYESPESAAYPSSLKHPGGYGTAVRYSSQCMIYNTNMVSPDELKTWEDLLNPKWKGMIGFQDPRTPGPPVTHFVSMWELWGSDKTVDFMRKLAEQGIRFTSSTMPLHEFVVAGEVGIGIGFPWIVEPQLKTAGAPVDWIRTEKIPSGPAPIALFKTAPHPNAAMVFIDWILSKEGQEAVRNSGLIPARPGNEPDWITKYNVQDLIYIPKTSWSQEYDDIVMSTAAEIFF